MIVMVKGNNTTSFPDEYSSNPLKSHGGFALVYSNANLSYFELPVLQG